MYTHHYNAPTYRNEEAPSSFPTLSTLAKCLQIEEPPYLQTHSLQSYQPIPLVYQSQDNHISKFSTSPWATSGRRPCIFIINPSINLLLVPPPATDSSRTVISKESGEARHIITSQRSPPEFERYISFISGERDRSLICKVACCGNKYGSVTKARKHVHEHYKLKLFHCSWWVSWQWLIAIGFNIKWSGQSFGSRATAVRHSKTAVKKYWCSIWYVIVEDHRIYKLTALLLVLNCSPERTTGMCIRRKLHAALRTVFCHINLQLQIPLKKEFSILPLILC